MGSLMEAKKFKQLAVDVETHRELTRIAKKTGRTRVGTLRWLLSEHCSEASSRGIGADEGRAA